MQQFDLLIRNGRIVDGTGAPAYRADLGLRNGRIAAIGQDLGIAAQQIDADGLLVTPGFVDVHTHFDGQATWDERLWPSSQQGVTTAVIGNCGVGFAPCRPEDRDTLIALMEGVEDIPDTALHEGLPWNWESFPEYLRAWQGSATTSILPPCCLTVRCASMPWASAPYGASRPMPRTSAPCRS
jgi:N-acyl-D-aspartate/D-glutamate deacylase